jgi:hypothetical protein
MAGDAARWAAGKEETPPSEVLCVSAAQDYFLFGADNATLLLFRIDAEKVDLLSRRHDRVKEVETETTIEESDYGTRFFDTPHPR